MENGSKISRDRITIGKKVSQVKKVINRIIVQQS